MPQYGKNRLEIRDQHFMESDRLSSFMPRILTSLLSVMVEPMTLMLQIKQSDLLRQDNDNDT